MGVHKGHRTVTLQNLYDGKLTDMLVVTMNHLPHQCQDPFVTPRSRGLLFVLFGVCTGLFCLIPMLQQFEASSGLNWLYHARGPRTPPAEVVIIGLNHQAAKNLRLPGQPNRWPRSLHARLLDGLTAQGVQAIGMDLLFDRTRDIEHDLQLAQAIQRAGNVTLVELARHENIAAGQATFSLEQRIPSIELLTKNAFASGPFMLAKNSENITRFWSFTPRHEHAPAFPVLLSVLLWPEAYQPLLQVLQQVQPLSTAGDWRQLAQQGQVATTLRQLHELLLSQPQYIATMRQALPKQQRYQQLLDILSAGGPHVFNLYGPIGSITTIPYDAALQSLQGSTADVSRSSFFKGKVVLIGFSEFNQSEQQDAYRTPFTSADGVDVSGVEIAATVLANILDGSLLQPISAWQRFGLLAIFGGLLTLPWMMWRVRPALWVTGIIVAGYVLLSVFSFKHRYLWLPLFIPLAVQFPLLLGAGMALHYRRAERARRYLFAALEQYLPHDVIRQLANHLPHDSDGMVYAACLCNDIEGYTALAEQYAPVDLRDRLNEYFQLAIPVIKQHQGHVIDIVGDAMMSVWVSFASPQDACNNACAAALELNNIMNVQRSHHALPTRIGVHFGPLYIGQVGTAQHTEVRAVGDIVNTASRIQSANRYLGTRILVSAAVLQHITQDQGRWLGDFQLAGKGQAIGLYEQPVPALSELALQAFATGVAAFKAGQLSVAIAAFTQVLECTPDGPSRFYLALLQVMDDSPPLDWSGVAVLPGK